MVANQDDRSHRGDPNPPPVDEQAQLHHFTRRCLEFTRTIEDLLRSLNSASVAILEYREYRWFIISISTAFDH